MFGNLGTAEIVAILVTFLLSVTPFLLLGVGAYFLFSRSAMGRAIMERSRRDPSDIPPAVAQEFDRLREELQEIHERLDFTERMLAGSRNERQLGYDDQSLRVPTPPEASAIR